MTYVNTEEMRRAAATADSAADSMRRSANTVDEAVRSLSQMFEQGYGGPGLRLIELLENMELPEVASQEAHPAVLDKWVIAKQVAVIEGNQKDIGYTIVEPSDLYDTEEQASSMINLCQLPIGWVRIRLSQLFPRAAATHQRAPENDLASWKARALEAENTVLKWEARATALDHASLDAILSALEDPQHQAEEEAEKAFYRNEGLELAALVAEDTDVAMQKFGGQVYDDGSQTRSDIVAAIRALKTQLPQEVQA